MRRIAIEIAALLAVAAAIALLAGIPGCLSPGTSAKKNPGEATAQEARAWDPAPLLVDARSAKSYEAGHLPGALMLNQDDFDTQLAPVLDARKKGQNLLVYCGSDACDASRSIARKLREMGVTGVFVLKGGMRAWL